MPRRWGICTLAVVFLLSGVAGAQEAGRSSPYFECPYINYFENGCPQTEEQEARGAPPAEERQEQPEVEADEASDYDWMEEAPENLLPLFPRQSVAPDTPPLYHLLLMRPTLENARRYVRWHARRTNRIREAQALIDLAGREFLAGGAARE